MAERPAEEDQDLLTCGEAAARLTEEGAKQRGGVERLRAQGVPAEVVEQAEARLTALREATVRNRKPSIDELRASGFFRRADG